jgi:RHS repeat-associated protein
MKGRGHPIPALCALALLFGANLIGIAEAQSTFTHRIGIKLPRGAGGTHPELSLVYDPGGGNGIVGMGWQLTGLPVITRVNYGEGINYAGADTYAHSQLGILVPQPDGSYRSKSESFVKLVPAGECGDGPCSWTAYHPSGSRSHYGTSPGSALLVQETSSVRQWGLARVADVFGNSYEVEYSTDPIDAADGQMYPTLVTYTKGPQIVAFRTVELLYEPRTDTEPGYYQSAFQRTTKRLKWIVVKSNGVLLRKYRLDYECGGSTCPSGSLSRRSRLVTVVEYGSNGVTTFPAAQRFTWQAGAPGFYSSSSWAPPADFTGRDGGAPGGWNSGLRTADLNGDGRLDLVQGWSNYGTLYRNAWLDGGGAGWLLDRRWAPPPIAGGYSVFTGRDGSAPYGWNSGLQIVDLDGNGRPDLVYGHNGTRSAWLNRPDLCPSLPTSMCAWTKAVGYVPPADFTGRDAAVPGGWDGGMRFAELNGDGKPDLVQAWSNYGTIYQNVWLNTGTGWQPSSAFAFPPATAYLVFTKRDASSPAGRADGLQLVDVNGDGRADLVYAYKDATGSARNVWLNTGNGWSHSPAFTPPVDFAGYFDSQRYDDGGVRWTDLNADGKPDIVQGLTTRVGVVYRSAHLNTGKGWVADAAYAPPLDIHYHQGGDKGVRFIDVNGDGRPDILRGHYDNGVSRRSAWINDESGWRLDAAYAPAFDFTGWDGSAPSGWDSGAELVDMGGDGHVDLVQGWYNYGAVYRRTYIPTSGDPDVVKAIDNGLGGTITVTYGISTEGTALVTFVHDSTAPGIPNTAPQRVVSSIVTSDGRGGSYRSEYRYRDPRILPGPIREQKNLGFASVTISTIRQEGAGDAFATDSTITYYNQSPSLAGRPASIEAWGGGSTPWEPGWVRSRTTFGYDVVQPAAGTELVREISQEVQTFEKGVPAFKQTTTTEYDAYGNPTVKAQSADGLPTVVVTTTYENDDEINWIFGRITGVKTTADGVTLGESDNVWTGHVIVEKRDWLDAPASWISTFLQYDANGNVTSVTEPSTPDLLVRRTTTAFDTTFRAYPTAVTNARGHVTYRTYNADGLITSVTDPNGNVTRTTYDVFGRPVKEARPDGGSTEYTYLAYGNPNLQRNRVVTWVDASHYTWKEDWFDGSGFTYQERISSDCPTDFYSIVDNIKDAAGKPSQVSLPYCPGATRHLSTTTYDPAGRIRQVTTPDGKTTTYGYGTNYEEVTDANGQTTRKYANARKKVTSVVDAAGQVTSYGYDALGRLISETLPNGQTTTITHDSLNRKRSVTVPQLGTTTYTYDAVANLLSATSGTKTVSFQYDALNRVTKKTPSGESSVQFKYDETDFANAKGRLTTREDAGGTTRFAYTVTGLVNNFVKSVDAKKFSQYLSYDWVGRPTQITYPDGSYADYVYTAHPEPSAPGKFTSGGLETLSLNGAVVATWSMYDAAGRPGRVAYANGVESTYAYDAVGHITSLRTVNGTYELQNLAYDWYGRPNTGGINIGSITDQRANKVVNGYATDETQSYTYDSLYRLIEAAGVWGTKPYVYDGGGNPTTFGGLTVRALTYNGQQVTSGTGLSGVTYDAAGNMLRKTLDGTTWDYAWTTENRLASVKKNGVLAAQMIYDADGQRVKKTYLPGTTQSVTTTYVNGLYEKRTYGDGSPERHTLHLVANGHVVASVTQSGNIVTALREANRWRSELAATTAYDGTTPLGAAKKLLHYLAAGVSHPAATRWLAGTILVAFALAMVGTIAAWGRRSRGAFSLPRRLAALSTAFVFGITACSGGPGGGLAEDASALVGGDTLRGPAVGTYFYHRNHVNSSSVITDAFGSEATRYVYLPFGEISQPNSAGNATVTRRFTGQELDEETGLYYFGARYYDAALGRFISADPFVPDATDAQLFNRYSYVRNNPIVYVDPTGHFLDFIGDAIRAVGNAFAAVGRAIADAVKWIAHAAVELGKLYIRAYQIAWETTKAMARNPMAVATFVLSVAVFVATGNPLMLALWIKGTLASIAATSMAMAAGVTNPTVLSLIGATAGAAGVGATTFMEFFKTGVSWAANQGLQALEGPKAAMWLAPANAMASAGIVNAFARNTKWVFTKDGALDPDAKGAEGYHDYDTDQCFAELKYRDANLPVVGKVGLKHTAWLVEDSAGNQYLVSAGPDGGFLEMWVTPDTSSNFYTAPDTVSTPTWWSSGVSSGNCAGVSQLLGAADSFPSQTIRYWPLGPNSNSAAASVGAAGGFYPPAPPGTFGWDVQVP